MPFFLWNLNHKPRADHNLCGNVMKCQCQHSVQDAAQGWFWQMPGCTAKEISAGSSQVAALAKQKTQQTKKETQLSTNGCPTKRAKKQKLNSRSWALRMKQEEGLRYSAFECLLQWRSSAQHLVLIANETLPSKPNLFQLQTKHLLRFPGVLRNLLSILLRKQLRCARWRYRHQGRNVCCKTYFTSCTALLAVSFFLVAFLESCLCSILYTMKSDPTSNIEIETIDASDNALGPWLV